MSTVSILAADVPPIQAKLTRLDQKLKIEDSHAARNLNTIYLGLEAGSEAPIDAAKREIEAAEKSLDIFGRVWGAYKVEVGRLASVEKEDPALWRALILAEESSTEPEDADMAIAWRHGFGLLRKMDRAHNRIADEIEYALGGSRIPKLRPVTRSAIEHIAGLWAEFQKMPNVKAKERALAYKHFFETRMEKPVPREVVGIREKEG